MKPNDKRKLLLSNSSSQLLDNKNQPLLMKNYRLRPKEKYIAEEDIKLKDRVWRLMDDPSSSRSVSVDFSSSFLQI